MKIVLSFILSVIVYTGVNAQENYAVSLIPKELLPYASAVLRNQEVSVEVKGLDNTVYHIKQALTILNKNGNDIAHIGVVHDKNRVIKSIKGVVYNEFGKLISKFSESDFEDQNLGGQSSLFEDARVKHFNPAVAEYPYTIVYEYEVKSKQTLVFDDWRPNSDEDMAVEKSTYTFTCKPDFKIRYKELNMPSKVVIGTDKQGNNTYTWTVNNLKAIKEEPYSPNADKYLSTVKISPVKFEYLGTSGSFTNWNEMGKWIYDNLLATRKTISPVTVAHMKQLTEGITDLKQKAKKIYEYMQSKTHYISVQVGIGGYQPFLADDVDQQNYGDCKALVNYTQALLKAVDVDSYYCIVKSGSRKHSPITDYASMNQFDHVILCLPLKNDTTFVECTSQKTPFGYLGDFTDDRIVLACTPTGGKLLHTPKLLAQNNVQQCKADFVLDTEGNLSGKMNTTFRGSQYDNREYIIEEAPTEQVKSLQKEYSINNLNIQKFSFEQDKSLQPVTTEAIKLEAVEYGSVNNGKIDFLPNVANRIESVPHDVRNRKFDLYINRGYTDEDEITIALPAGYHVDLRPENSAIDKPFGKFTTTINVIGDKLIYKRKLQVLDGTYNKDLYPDFVNFYQAVNTSDNSNITLIKNN